MSTIKFGTGIYILREEASRDLFGVMKKLADIGFEGIELLGFFGKEPGDIRRKADELGVKVMSNHINAADFFADPDKVIADHKELGVETLVISWPGNVTHVAGKPEHSDMMKQVAGLCELCVKNGITPLYHNHGWDFDGTPAHFDAVTDHCASAGMQAEPDIGWMAVAGVDPIYYLEKYKDRIPVIHLKDVYFENWNKIGDKEHLPHARGDAARGNFEFRPTGYGVVPNALYAPYYLACRPKWILIDHDLAYDRDPYDDLRLSLEYVKNLLNIANY